LNETQTEFQRALATARHALEQFNAEPLVASKRGGPRLSPWFRVWVQASEVAQRWHRQQSRRPDPTLGDLDTVIDEILSESQQGGGSET
jgi:cell division septum initiation protein DivIVA